MTYVTEDDRTDYFNTFGHYGSDTEVSNWIQSFAYTQPQHRDRFNPSKEAAKQVGGNHYQLPIQPIDYILKNGLGYCEANVIKYVTRHAKKNGAEDIKKAIHYLEMILENDYAD